eukprot:9358946-Pyramimonas_sp.AAC.3
MGSERKQHAGQRGHPTACPRCTVALSARCRRSWSLRSARFCCRRCWRIVSLIDLLAAASAGIVLDLFGVVNGSGCNCLCKRRFGTSVRHGAAQVFLKGASELLKFCRRSPGP